MDEFKINDTVIPVPVKWQVQEQAVTTAYSGKQTLDGKLHNSVIRHRRVITAQWGMLKGAEVAVIRRLLSGNIIKVRFPEANEEGFEEINVIPGQHTRPILVIVDGETYWKSLQVKLTEV